LKVAIIHYWLVGMRGGEKVVESLCRIFPDADIFTHVYVPSAVSDVIRSHQVRTSFINSLPRAHKFYQKYLPLMPIALEQLDLRGYDLIISSESGPAKGIIPPPDSLHICYCHSPMRYVWNMFHDYRERSGPFTKALMPPIAHYVRNWDAISSTRVDHYIANSSTVQARIKRYYRRDSHVISPPVEVDDFEIVPEEVSDFYLMVGELVPYKRPDLAVEAFNRLQLPLVIIGGGEMLGRIRAQAGSTIKVLGAQPFPVLRHHYARCRALIFPGEEDFGIVPVEAQASGRPVIAYGRGGATETVRAGFSGLLFQEQTVEALISAVESLKGMTVDTLGIAKEARRFSAGRFRYDVKQHIDRLLTARTQILTSGLASEEAGMHELSRDPAKPALWQTIKAG
jgi:glycosyltransferase involved in cell wall biosynthesis